MLGCSSFHAELPKAIFEVRRMKKSLMFVAVLVMVLALSVSALAEVKVSVSETELTLMQTDKVTLTLTITGLEKTDEVNLECTFKDEDMLKLVSSKVGHKTSKFVVQADKSALGETEVYISGTAGETEVNKTITVNIVPYNAVPEMKWYNIQYNEENNYPQLKVSMTDDMGLSNICYVRKWTDENGEEQHEIYDIISLHGKQEAVVFRTLDKVGAYSIQINDIGKDYCGKTQRYDSKTLITLVDMDGNGVPDAYYLEDKPLHMVELDVEGALDPVTEDNDTKSVGNAGASSDYAVASADADSTVATLVDMNNDGVADAYYIGTNYTELVGFDPNTGIFTDTTPGATVEIPETNG